jgi:hypothetical protein
MSYYPIQDKTQIESAQAHYSSITSGPGKFECEPNYTPYYWEGVLEGDGEDHVFADDDIVTTFCVDAYESEAFELPIHSWVMVWETDQGFVQSRWFRERETMLAEIYFESATAV